MAKKPSSASLMLEPEVEQACDHLEAAGCEVRRDKDAGTAEVTDGRRVALRGLRKGAKGQPWIVMFYNTDRIEWSRTPDGDPKRRT